MEVERIEGMDGQDDDDEGDGDATSKGWPLGLLPMSTKSADAGAASCMILPSCTSSSGSSSSSSSSSDFDSESMGSFFPENSTSLGTLMGIETSSQFSCTQDLSEEEKCTSKRLGLHRRLYSLLGCAGRSEDEILEEDNVDEEWMEVSTSFPRFWDADRTDTTQSAPTSMRHDIAVPKRQLEDAIAFHNHNTAIARRKGWTRSNSCGPSLHVPFQKHGTPSPWRSIFSMRNRSSASRNGDLGSQPRHRPERRSTRSHIYSFWVSFCNKLSSTLAAWSM